VGIGREVGVCDRAAVGREVVEGAEEGPEGCAACGYEAESWFDC
jgi:hypothetical protein